MIRTSVTLVALLLLSVAPVAHGEEIQSFKKATVLGMKDGKPQRIDTAGFQTPITASVNGIFIEFEFEGSHYKLKASDTEFDGKVERACLAGEIKYATANQQIGATQMGSGASACVKD